MPSRQLSRWIRLLLLVLCASCATTESPKAPVETSRGVQEKIANLIANGTAGVVEPKTTAFSESEVNTALTVNLKEKIPKGIADAQVKLLGNSRIAARVVVDVDEFKRRSKRKSSGPLNFLGGKIPIVVSGGLVTGNGQGQFKLQSAEANGIPLPKSLVLDLLASYTRTRNHPAGFDLEKLFDLPAGIRAVIVNAGEAIVVQ